MKCNILMNRCGLFIQFFLSLWLIVMASSAVATPPAEPISAILDLRETRRGLPITGSDSYIAQPPGPGKVGETIKVPLRIHSSLKWASAQLSFTVKQSDWAHSDPQLVQIESITLASDQQGPTVVYIPIVVKGEGAFEVKGELHVEMPEGETVPYWGGASSANYSLKMGVFAIEGNVAIDEDSNAARALMALYNVTSGAKQIQKLEMLQKERQRSSLQAGVDKDSSPETKALHQEANKIWGLSREENIRLYELYRSRHPENKIPQTKALPGPLKKGDRQDVRVNWPVDASHTSFLPLDGATIIIRDNAGISPDIFGFLSQGLFTFTVPEDGFSFRVIVEAKTADFQLQLDEGSSPKATVAIAFDNDDVFNIIKTIHPADSLIDITEKEANAWSVFQGMVEMTRLASSELGVTKASGYLVDFDTDPDRSFYCLRNGGVSSQCPQGGYMNIAATSGFFWDVIAHEFGHAIADETSSVNGVGGYHTGNNQYDIDIDNKGNPVHTYQNKDLSLALAMNEGYGTWMGVRLLKNSSYNGKMSHVGDDAYTSGGSVHQLEPAVNYVNAFGEDAEFALANLLWDLTDNTGNEVNARAKCLECKDSINISLQNLFQFTFQGKNNRNISEYYKNLYSYHTGTSVGNIESPGAGKSALIQKTHQLGSIFAEFGIAPNIDETDNAGIFDGYHKPGKTPPQITCMV